MSKKSFCAPLKGHGWAVRARLALRLRLLDAVPAAFEACGLGASVIRPIARSRSTPDLRRIETGLAGSPAMALKPILAELLLALAVLRIHHKFAGSRAFPLVLS